MSPTNESIAEPDVSDDRFPGVPVLTDVRRDRPRHVISEPAPIADVTTLRPGTPLPARDGAASARLTRRSALLGSNTGTAAADAIAIAIAGLIFAALLPGLHVSAAATAVVALCWFVAGGMVYGLKRSAGTHVTATIVDELPMIAQVGLLATASSELIGSRLTVPGALALAASELALLVVARMAVRTVQRRHTGPERVVLIAGQATLERFERKLELEQTLNARLVAMIDPTQLGLNHDPEPLAEATQIIAEESGVDRVIIGMDDLTPTELYSVVQAVRSKHLRVTVLPTITGAIGSRARLGQVGEWPALEFDCRPASPLDGAAKRAFDILLSSLMLIGALPLFAVIALLIKLDDGGPVFFRQVRGGKGGLPFRMWKFRTMVPDAEEQVRRLVDASSLTEPMYEKTPSDTRITRAGKFLRNTSLDEVPQLLNVLRGEMSLVGPRPEDYRLVQLYDADALAVRCGVKPGITGPMQVHGRGELQFSERLVVEREYIENHSLAKDIRILALTVGVLFARKGAF